MSKMRRRQFRSTVVVELLEGRRLLDGALSAILGGVTPQTPSAWVASIQIDGLHQCTGALIAKDAVLTSASCVLSESDPSLMVRFGGGTEEHNSDPVEVGVTLVSPYFDPITGNADLAVLLLRDAVETLAITPGLPGDQLIYGEQLNYGEQVQIFGWNNSEFENLALRTLMLPVGETPITGTIPSTSFVFERPKADVGVCGTGARGAPVVKRSDDNNLRLVGILSSGSCGQSEAFDAAIDLSHFRTWIDSIIRQEEQEFLQFTRPPSLSDGFVEVFLQYASDSRDPSVTLRTNLQTAEPDWTSRDSEGFALTSVPGHQRRFIGRMAMTSDPLRQFNQQIEARPGEVLFLTTSTNRQNRAASIRVNHTDPQPQFTAEPFPLGESVIGSKSIHEFFQFAVKAGRKYELASRSPRVVWSDGGPFFKNVSTDVWLAENTSTVFLAAKGLVRIVETEDDHSDLLGFATTIEVGQELEGSFHGNGRIDRDIFAAQLDAGSPVRIELQSEDGDIDLQVGTLRTVLSTGNKMHAGDQYFYRFSFVPDQSTTYYIRTRSDEPANYSLRVELLEDESPQEQALVPDRVYSGNIEAFGDFDVFDLDVTEGERWFISVKGNSGRLIDASGEVVSTFATSRGFAWDVTATGQYRLEVTAPGDYEVSIWPVEDDVTDAPGADAPLLSAMQPKIVVHELPGDVDVFAFEAGENPVVINALSRHSYSQLQIFSESGEALSEEARSTAPLVWPPPSPGRYYVATVGEGGIYELTIRELGGLPPIQEPEDEAPEVPSEATPLIASGDVLLGRLDSLSDLDVFAFDAEPGLDYHFSVLAPQPGHTSLRILDGDGLVIEDRYFNTASWRAHEAGRYYIELRVKQSTGVYQIALSTSMDDYPSEEADGTLLLTTVDPVSVWIDSDVDSDTIRFEAKAGKDYILTGREIRFAGESGWSRFAIELDGPDGQPVAAATTKVEFSPRQSGTYTARVKTAKFLPEKARVQVTLYELEDDHYDKPYLPLVSSIELGQAALGVFERANDLDVFSLETVAGEVYQVSSEATPETVRFRLVAPQDLTVLSGNCCGFPEMQWKAPTSGIHYIQLEPWERISLRDEPLLPISYQFKVSSLGQAADDYPDELPTDAISTLPLDIAGELEEYLDRDVHVFDANRGDAFHVEFGGPDPDIEFVISDASGNQLAEWPVNNWPNGLWVAPNDGIYYATVSRDALISDLAGVESPGTYQLEFRQHSDDRPNLATDLEPIQSPITLHGLVDYAADTDVFLVDIEPNVKYVFEHNDSVYLSVRDLDGQNANSGLFGVSPTLFATQSRQIQLHINGLSTPQPWEVSVRVLEDDFADYPAPDNFKVAVGAEQSAVLNQASDTDVFRVLTEADGIYRIHLKSEKGLRVRVTYSRTLLAGRAVDSGVFVARGNFSQVYISSPNGELGEYSFKVEKIDALPDTGDNDFSNPRIVEASPIHLVGDFEHLDDVDHYQFSVIGGQEYSLRPSNNLGRRNFEIHTGNRKTRIGSALSFVAAETGAAVLRVTPDDEIGAYDVFVRATPTDFNSDGEFNAEDIDALFAATQSMEIDKVFDVNQDETVDAADSATFLAITGILQGDTNLDGRVDFTDFLLLSGSYQSGGGWREGDFDGDKRVSFADFLVLSANFGKRGVSVHD